MKYLLASLIILFTGCKSAEKLAAQKAAKEDIARKERIQLMEDARKAFPCDTVTEYITEVTERIIPGDTTVIDSVVYITLPGKEITQTRVQTIIDRIEVEKLTMQLESLQYAAQLQAEENILQDDKIRRLEDENKELNKQKLTLMGIIIAIAICIGIYGFIQLKKIL